MTRYFLIVLGCVFIAITGGHVIQSQSTLQKFHGLFRTTAPTGSVQAEKLLNQIIKDLQGLRSLVADTLEKKMLNPKAVNALVKSLQDATSKLSVFEGLDATVQESLREKGIILLQMYQALLEEAAVLNLWLSGYAGYEKDLNDNFRKLPNKALGRPGNDKLYEVFGLSGQEGKKASFNVVRKKYQELYDTLQRKAPGQSFDKLYFDPYLRVLDYVFRTPYSKSQYGVYLDGPESYDKKAQEIKRSEKTIKKLFEEDLPELKILTGTIQAELGIKLSH